MKGESSTVATTSGELSATTIGELKMLGLFVA